MASRSSIPPSFPRTDAASARSQEGDLTPAPFYLGVDFGTSGCRAVAVDERGEIVDGARVELPPPRRDGARCEQDAGLWWEAIGDVLRLLGKQLPLDRIAALAIDGTSGTLMLCDDKGAPLAPALMYNDSRARAEAERVAAVAPPESAAHGASSALAKLLYLQREPRLSNARPLSQAEWLAGRLISRYDVGDENNCLKLGYDVIERRWPAWLAKLNVAESRLPRVVPAGTCIGHVAPDVAGPLGLSPRTRVLAGTTDSTAAFIATGACEVGDAVTSLGSTLVMKVISDKPVFSPAHGVYSHRLGERWLAGGGSNSGGAVLLHYFTRAELDALTPHLRPEQPTGLDYYPLLTAGERFPVSDPQLAPRLAPRPQDPVLFFQGMLEGMAAIEAASYRLLADLGAPYPKSVRSAGGGAHNVAWSRIREQALGVTVTTPAHTEAAYGAALLAAGRVA